MADAVRSCGRGIGVARQSRPVNVVAIAGLNLSDDPVVRGGPIAPSDFVVAGSFFLLREVELAAAKVEHVAEIREAGGSAARLQA